MNDEIKEILDKLKDGNWYNELDLTGTMWIELRWEETHLLLDYITNLQQENQELNDSITWWTNRFNAVQRDYEELKQENERLKQPQIFIDTQDMEERYGEELYKDYLKKQLKDYKSRIEKADWYLLESLECLYHGANFTFDELIHNTSDILNGRSDE